MSIKFLGIASAASGRSAKRAVALCAVFCASAVLPLCADAAQIDASQFERSFNITFPGYAGSSPLTDFPVLAPADESFICLGNDNAPNSSYGNTPQVFNGSIDEFRISNVARSSDWVKATYDTIKNNATFTAYGAAREQVRGLRVMFK